MSVIVFAVNGLPAGWLGTYGNDWVGTPHLDRLAAEAVVFDRHISDCPEPTAARRAWLGVREEPTPPAPLPEGKGEEDPRARLAADAAPGSSSPFPSGRGAGGVGRLSVLVRANHPDTDGPDWFYAGWGEVFDARPQADDNSPLEELIRVLPALLDRLASVPAFLLWIETDRLIPPWDVQQDVFEAYLNDDEEKPLRAEEVNEDESDEEDEEESDTAEVESDSAIRNPQSAIPEQVPPFADPPTGPFDRADPDAWDWLHKTFAAVVTKLDAELGALFDLLRERGLGERAAWLVTSDFGHPLGEHGQIGPYRPWLHEELVHLPLILRLPNAEQAGRRVPGFTQPPDVFPTLLALLGITPPAVANGFDLLPLSRGQAESRRAFAVTQLELGDAAEIALRTADSALLVPTRVPDGDPKRDPLLYEKPDDRWEVNNVRQGNIDRADELEARLREAIK